jgi:hypothetical protein
MRESDVVAEQGGGSRVRRRQRTPAVWPLCNARPVDWLFVAFVGLLAVALAVAIAFGLDRERALDAARAAVLRGNAIPSDDADADLPTLIRRLRDRLDESEFELDQQVRNASYLAEPRRAALRSRPGPSGTLHP